MKKNPLAVIIVCIAMVCCKGFYAFSCQAAKDYKDSLRIDSRKLTLVVSSHAAIYAGTLWTLDYMWYRDFPRTHFHWHDDSRDWKQMDKMGHAFTAYQLSVYSHRSFTWTGMNNQQAALWGSIAGNTFLTTIEILDGFSAEWGASWSDLLANAAGASLFYVQQRVWEEQRVHYKFSFSPTPLRSHRPDLLGNNSFESIIKDYNGQTYWLSFHPSVFHNYRTDFLPWLNLSAGYGAYGMLGSSENPLTINGTHTPAYERERIFYLSLDLNWLYIKTGARAIDPILPFFNWLKTPAPTLSYSTVNGWQWHWIFF